MIPRVLYETAYFGGEGTLVRLIVGCKTSSIDASSNSMKGKGIYRGKVIALGVLYPEIPKEEKSCDYYPLLSPITPAWPICPVPPLWLSILSNVLMNYPVLQGAAVGFIRVPSSNSSFRL
jgi:hypothetical protein